MKKVHHQEKEQFQRLFEQAGIDRIKDRFAVLEIFLQTEQHVTAEELGRMLADGGWRLEAELVEETLGLMCRFGFAHRVTFDNGEVRYEHRHLGQHHDHMICTKCRRIIEFEDQEIERLQLKAAAAYGFHMLQHKLEIYGICADCLDQRVKVIPLSMARQGERVQVKEFLGGAHARLRLLAMGIRPGDSLEVITNHAKGQVVIALDYNRYVLGRGQAQKILVEPVGA